MAIPIGDKFGMLTVLAIHAGSRDKRVMYECICECGNKSLKTDKYLKNYKKRSCGCHKIIKETKVCSMCKENKPKTDFHKLNNKKIGVQAKCKICTASYKKERYWSDHEEQLKKYTASRTKPDNVIQRNNYYVQNKAAYYDRYKKLISDPIKKKKRDKKHLIYRKSQRGKDMVNLYYHKKKKTDMHYVIKRRLGNRLRNIVKELGGNKYRYKSSRELLGCEVDFFKDYLESTFKDGISWDNISDWDIDHIKPCKKFDLTILEEQQKCFHYSNLQALWRLDNIRKSDKYDG